MTASKGYFRHTLPQLPVLLLAQMLRWYLVDPHLVCSTKTIVGMCAHYTDTPLNSCPNCSHISHRKLFNFSYLLHIEVTTVTLFDKTCSPM